MNIHKIPRNGFELSKCMDCWIVNYLETFPIREYYKFFPRNMSAKPKCRDSFNDKNRD